MATINCSYGGFAYYNGGYTPSDGYMNDSSGGYIGDGDGYGYVAKLVIPSAAGAAAGRSLTVTLGLMTLYYSDITLEYWITNEGRPAGVNYGDGPPPIKGKELLHGTVGVGGLNGSNWSYKTFTTGATSSLSAGGGTYYLWLRSNRNAVAGGGSAPTIKLNYTAITSCTPPTSASASPSPFESGVTLSWSGAGAGVSNPIVGYDVYYRDSPNGSAWSGWTWYANIPSSGTGGSANFSPGIGRGGYCQFRVHTLGQAGQNSGGKETNTVKKNSVPAAPSSVSVSATTILSGTEVTVSWPAARDPDGNLARYRVERTVNGGSSWEAVTTTGGTSVKQSVNVNVGTRVQYRVRSEDALGAASGYVYSSAVSVIGVCKAPSVVSLSLSVFETQLTVSWSGAGSGALNSITGFRLQFSTSGNGVQYGEWETQDIVSTSAGSGSYTHMPPLARGSYIRYRVQTLGTAGSLGYSGYSSTVSARKNSLPAAPATLTLSDNALSLHDTFTAVWSGAADADGNISGYEVSLGGAVVKTVTTSATSGSAVLQMTEAVGDEKASTVRVVTVDSFGCKSPAKEAAVTRVDRAVCVGSGGAYPRYRVFLGIRGKWEKAEALYGKGGKWEKLLAPKTTVPAFHEVQLTGPRVSYDTSAAGVPLSGKLYAATEASAPAEISVYSGNTLRQTLKIGGKDNALLQLCGVTVESGETYTDSNGQKWVCDEYDVGIRTLTKRIQNGGIAAEPVIMNFEELGYPPELFTCLGNTTIECAAGELQITFKEATK